VRQTLGIEPEVVLGVHGERGAGTDRQVADVRRREDGDVEGEGRRHG
jgi:hypothetical protein